MNYIIPDINSHVSSFIVCIVIWGSFAYFLARRIKSKKNAVNARKFLELLSKSELVDHFEKIVKQSRRNQNTPLRVNLQMHFKECIEKAIQQQDNDSKDSKSNKKEKRTSSANQAIYDHLESLFLAGSFESRLETDALIKHTELKLFHDAVLLKNILSTFIILGLLGTLIGLAESLSLFDDTSSKMTELVRIQLPEAFKPSISGVICTILGMISYSRLVHIYFTPLKTSLENLTLNVWLPKLYPVFTERLIDKLEDNAKRIEDQFASAAKVADFARNIEDETSKYHDNLTHGNELIGKIEPVIGDIVNSGKLLKQFADKMNKFSENFTKGMDTFKAYEEKLAVKYESLSSSNVNLANHLSDWVTKFETMINHYNAQVVEINGKTKNIYAAIMDFEEQYLDASKEQVEAVTGLVKTVKQDKESDVMKNREITEKILVESSEKFAQILAEMGHLTTTLGANLTKIDDSLSTNLGNVDTNLVQNLKNLNSEVAKGLTGMQSELTGGLGAIPLKLEDHHTKILTQFDRYDTPVKAAAEKIEGSYYGMVTAIQSLIQQFHNAMVEHHSKLENHVAEKLSQVSAGLQKNEEKLAGQETVNSRLTLAIEALNQSIIDQKSERRFKLFS